MSPSAPRKEKSQPRGTVVGALLWAAASIAHALDPSTPLIWVMGFQVLGLLMAGFGVVNATAALVNSAPYLRFGGSGTVRVWPPAVMLVGINWYALMLAAGHFAAAQYIPLISSMGALAQAASVIGWRMWIHYLVLQSHQT